MEGTRYFVLSKTQSYTYDFSGPTKGRTTIKPFVRGTLYPINDPVVSDLLSRMTEFDETDSEGNNFYHRDGPISEKARSYQVMGAPPEASAPVVELDSIESAVAVAEPEPEPEPVATNTVLDTVEVEASSGFSSGSRVSWKSLGITHQGTVNSIEGDKAAIERDDGRKVRVKIGNLGAV